MQRRTPLWSADEAIEQLRLATHPNADRNFYAFYSSEAKGITKDPVGMVVPIDDHMAHRGHAVFDTALITQGYLYQLDRHLDRLVASAAAASIPLPPDGREGMRTAILHTAAASCVENGSVRYWLSAGRGGFGLSGKECVRPSFYCIVYGSTPAEADPEEEPAHLRGWKVMTSSVPIKSGTFATLKSNNYLPNALCLMEAEAAGCDQGIFVDDEGFVAEGPNCNVMALLPDGELVTPPFDKALAGITAQRVLELVGGLLESGDIADFPELGAIKKVSQRPIKVDEIKGAEEVMMLGSTTKATSVVQWDAITIGSGAPGTVTLALRRMIENDMEPPGPEHVEVPYGYVTGMEL
ncbi:unnamed protein product [Pedinophyceae sp. YPF-701]|nr:unnamed protein product [Pedinophyceae sp. YPF-701]